MSDHSHDRPGWDGDIGYENEYPHESLPRDLRPRDVIEAEHAEFRRRTAEIWAAQREEEKA